MEITAITPLISHKKPWARLVNADVERRPMADPHFYDIPEESFGDLAYQYLGNAELLTECTEGARPINSNLYSTRPIYEIVEREIKVIGEGGVIENKKVREEVIVGYDRIENVRSGLGDMIAKQKASHLGQNGIMIADESGKDPEAYDTLRAWKDIVGLDAAWIDALYHAGTCGDAAVYLYQRGRKIEYTLFSFRLGDILFPQKDNKGDEMIVRLYKIKGRDVVDVFMTDYIETWVRGDIEEIPQGAILTTLSPEQTWWQSVRGWFRNISHKKSNDGWTRISSVRSQLDDHTCQVAYLRFADSFIGPAMQNLEALDRALSYTSDKMRSTAFSKLLVKAVKIENLPPLTSGEEVIGIGGDVESLKASDVKHVAPPDISNIATINIKNIRDAVMESTMSVDLQPEILKSGADSSQTLKLLLRREIQWCHVMWPHVRPMASKMIDIHKGLVGKIEGEGERYDRVLVSVWNIPWMPQDEDALANRVQQLTFSGILSQKGAREEMGLQYTDDAKQIATEQEEKIYRETYIKLKAQAQARKDFGLDETANDVVVDKSESGEAPKSEAQKVDNQAPNKP